MDVISEGEDLYDARVRETLAPTGGSRSLAEFQKVKSQVFTDAPHPFRVHFYFDTVTGKARTDLEYKIRFTPYFTP